MIGAFYTALQLYGDGPYHITSYWSRRWMAQKGPSLTGHFRDQDYLHGPQQGPDRLKLIESFAGGTLGSVGLDEVVRRAASDVHPRKFVGFWPNPTNFV
jgi:hypothetical protein